MTKACDSILYGGLLTEVSSAAGAKGVLIRTADRTTVFRAYGGPDRFTDYDPRHDDLGVSINADELDAFYKIADRDILDHRLLGLRRTGDR